MLNHSLHNVKIIVFNVVKIRRKSQYIIECYYFSYLNVFSDEYSFCSKWFGPRSIIISKVTKLFE